MRSIQVFISIILLIASHLVTAEGSMPSPSLGTDQFNTLLGQAAKGDANAQNKVAMSYMQGTGVPLDINKAFIWFEKAANQNHDEAQYNYATFILNGYATTKSPERALTWFEKSAQQGNTKAQNSLGILHMIGLGTKVNYSESFKWNQKAAEGGIPDAMYNLGQLYEKGAGTQKNSFKAVYWYEQAAKQGFTGAEFELGVAHANGLGGYEKNITKAIEWYEKAAKKGNMFAQANLGHIYSSGCSNADSLMIRNDKGIKSIGPNDYRKTCNEKQAMFWYQKAAELGLPDAQLIIGDSYLNRVDINKLTGLEWISKSAQNGNTNAKRFLAKHKEKIEQINKELLAGYKKESESWPYKSNSDLRNATTEQNPLALEHKAIAYHFGLLGQEQNLVTATDRYIEHLGNENALRFSNSQKNLETILSVGLQQSALHLKDEHASAKTRIEELANNGDLAAAKFMARFYASGSCEYFSMKDARYWYEKAANLNDKDAMLALARLYKSSAPNQSGPDANPDYSKSLYWFNKLDLSDKPNAQYDLAEVYLFEKSATYNPAAAIELLEMASRKNHIEAKKALAKIYQEGKAISMNQEKAAGLMKEVAQLEKPPTSSKAIPSMRPPKRGYCSDSFDEFDASPDERLILKGGV